MSEKKDRGWEYLKSASDENFEYDPDNDGSWGYQNDDGSGSFYGSDGSWGYKNSDGSGSYYGNDGSWGYRNADGSSSYYGNDGSWGYRNSDGSGSFYGADGESRYYDSSDNDSYLDDSSSNSGSGGEALGTLLGLGLAAYMIHKNKKEQQQREEEQRQEEERRKHELQEEARRIRLEKNRAKRLAFYKQHWKTIIAIITILICCSFGYYKYTQFQKLINVSTSSDSLIGQDHDYVKQLLQKAGFTNINDNVIRDLEISEVKQEGKVTEVLIHGDKDFTPTSRYPYDVHIDIIYHIVKKINVPISSKSAKKQDYKAVEKQFKDAGFVNIIIKAKYDLLTGWITKDGSVESVSVNGDKTFDEHDLFRPDVKVVITFHTFSKKKK